MCRAKAGLASLLKWRQLWFELSTLFLLTWLWLREFKPRFYAWTDTEIVMLSKWKELSSGIKWNHGRVHFLLRSISPSQIHLNYSVIVPCFSSPSQKENLLNAFSNQNVGKYSTFSNGNTFSAPSQMEYMFYISRNLLRFFSMEIPSQLLLKWSTCSTSVLMISYEIRKSLESKNSHSAHQSTYLFALCMVWATPIKVMPGWIILQV